MTLHYDIIPILQIVLLQIILAYNLKIYLNFNLSYKLKSTVKAL